MRPSCEVAAANESDPVNSAGQQSPQNNAPRLYRGIGMPWHWENPHDRGGTCVAAQRDGKVTAAGAMVRSNGLLSYDMANLARKGVPGAWRWAAVRQSRDTRAGLLSGHPAHGKNVHVTELRSMKSKDHPV